jgi:hypothetical protein
MKRLNNFILVVENGKEKIGKEETVFPKGFPDIQWRHTDQDF